MSAAPGTKRLALLVPTIAGCLAVFFVARLMAQQPHVAVTLTFGPDAHSLVHDTSESRQELLGDPVRAIVDPAGRRTEWPAHAVLPSLRWVSDDATRRAVASAWRAGTAALAQGGVTFELQDGRRHPRAATARGYAALGANFWMLSAYAVVLWLAGGMVLLLRPRWSNVLYLVMALSQAAQLLLTAMASVPAMVPPAPLGAWGGMLDAALDLVTCSALLHAAAVYPRPLRWHRRIALLGWLATLGWIALTRLDALPHAWWWAQALTFTQGTTALVLLSLTLRIEAHPFAFVMRRIGVLLWGGMFLMVGINLFHLHSSGIVLMQDSVPLWSVFTASVVLLVPFLAHSRRVMREVPLVAGTAALAMLVYLLFIFVLDMAPVHIMLITLLLALAAHAAVSRWVLQQAADARMGATERMFEHLYRVARDVETRPERARQRMTELLEHVFEPLSAQPAQSRSRRSSLAGNGNMLLIPMPAVLTSDETGAMWALRGAERGRRLFTPDDARLADRIVEQLMRAVAQDRAVARGRNEERARIAQDLHDDIGARLLTLMYKASTPEMENYVRHTLQDLKTLTRGLAAQSQPLSLAAAEWKRDMTDRARLADCALSWTSAFDAEVTLTSTEWSALTRIVRELVSNVIAHARASQAHIECRLDRGRLFLSCTDNGQGTHPEQWSRGLGLGGIRKRVRLLGGEVHWREQDPHGIACEVTVPRLCGWAPPDAPLARA